MGLKIYFDGGCKPNPGMMEVGIVFEDGARHHSTLSYGTNNQAEWVSLLWAMALAAERGVKDVEFIGDSKLVISQAGGAWKCNSPELRVFLADYQSRTIDFDRIKLTHVLRGKNLAGKYLETR